MVNLKNGKTRKETYIADKDETIPTEGSVPGVSAKKDDIVMVEIRSGKLNIWVDWKNIKEDVFVDKEIGGEANYVAIEFENTADGDLVSFLGYDELEGDAPKYEVPPVPIVNPKGK